MISAMLKLTCSIILSHFIPDAWAKGKCEPPAVNFTFSRAYFGFFDDLIDPQ